MKTILVMFCVLVVGFTFQGFAQQGPPPMGRLGIMKELKLTADQEAQFKKIHFETRKTNIVKNADLKTARLELRQMFDEEKQDKAAIEKKIAEISSIRSSIAINRYNAWSECNSLLDKDQQKIWKRALMNTMERRGMDFRGMHRRSPSPRMMMNRQHQPLCPGNAPDTESH